MTLSVVFDFLSQHPELRALRLDSTRVQPGDLFIAIPGRITDGRTYIAQAIKNGAAAILAEAYDLKPYAGTVPLLAIPNLKAIIADIAAHFYQNPSQALKVIAITGTNGKTSTSHYVAQLLAAKRLNCGLMGTIGNGFLGNLNAAHLTTSDCCTIQDQLAMFVKQKADFVAMEVSSIGLMENRLTNTCISTAVFTNLTQDHLDYHADMEEYFAAKCKLFMQFTPQYSIVNLDDPYSERLLKIIPLESKIITYSLSNPNAAIYYSNGVVTSPWGKGTLHTALVGKFNISNVLAAIACCAVQGIAFQDLLLAAQKLQPVAGRMQSVPSSNPNAPKVVVDYAHTPEAVIKALQALNEYKPHKLYCIIGCGGDRDRSKRPLMLNAAITYSDVVIVTQDNPRTEDPKQIVQDMLQEVSPDANLIIEFDRAKAIELAVSKAKPQDIILIAGKGHEDYQIIGTTKIPFSDLLIAQQALEVRREQAWI